MLGRFPSREITIEGSFWRFARMNELWWHADNENSDVQWQGVMHLVDSNRRNETRQCCFDGSCSRLPRGIIGIPFLDSPPACILPVCTVWYSLPACVHILYDTRSISAFPLAWGIGMKYAGMVLVLGAGGHGTWYLYLVHMTYDTRVR